MILKILKLIGLKTILMKILLNRVKILQTIGNKIIKNLKM